MNEPKKLRPRCGDSQCGDNLHCYHQARSRSQRRSRSATSMGAASGTGSSESGTVVTSSSVAQTYPAGSCQTCGTRLVPWERVQRRDLLDAAHTFDQLKTELIRHHEFHTPLHQHAINYAKRKGLVLLKEKVAQHLKKSIGPAKPFRDGSQTHYPTATDPRGQDIIYSAQHATACCCRKCAELWHGIPQGRDMTEEELSYLTELAMLFIRERLPDIGNGREYVPRVRRPRQLDSNG
jgi:hypothetical protein